MPRSLLYSYSVAMPHLADIYVALTQLLAEVAGKELEARRTVKELGMEKKPEAKKEQ